MPTKREKDIKAKKFSIWYWTHPDTIERIKEYARKIMPVGREADYYPAGLTNDPNLAKQIRHKKLMDFRN